MTGQSPEQIVRSFLGALEAGEPEAAGALLAADVEYTNVTLPTLRGRDRVMRVLGLASSRGIGFRVHYVAVAADGTTVLTDRIDELSAGRFAQRFWVYGRFEVVDGRITVWRDAFDWLDITVGLVRGLAGVLSPALNRRWPHSD